MACHLVGSKGYPTEVEDLSKNGHVFSGKRTYFKDVSSS